MLASAIASSSLLAGNRHNSAKNFFAKDIHVGGHISKDQQLENKPIIALPSTNQARTLRFAAFNQSQHFVKVL